MLAVPGIEPLGAPVLAAGLDALGQEPAVLAALRAGALAGLGVALPLGAIGVLLINEGLRRGWRSGLAGAAGVAVVDLCYAGIAVVLGASVAGTLAPVARQIQLLGAAVLVAVAIGGLRSTISTRRDAQVTAATDQPGGGGREVAGLAGGQRAFLRFMALTAINPLTAIYFIALTVALADQLASAAAGSAFVLGVFTASLVWQSLLVAVGVLAGGRLPAAARTAVSIVGYLVVAAYAVSLALG